MASSIRITLTPKIERVLKELQEERFGLLEPAEIIRAILSEYDAFRQQRRSSALPGWMTNPEWRAFQAWEASLPITELSKEQWQGIDTARQEEGVSLPRTELWKNIPPRRV